MQKVCLFLLFSLMALPTLAAAEASTPSDVLVNTSYFNAFPVSVDGNLVTVAQEYTTEPVLPVRLFKHPNSSQALATCGLVKDWDRFELPRAHGAKQTGKGCGLEVFTIIKGTLFTFYARASTITAHGAFFEVPLKGGKKWAWLEAGSLSPSWGSLPSNLLLGRGQLAPGMSWKDIEMRTDKDVVATGVSCKEGTLRFGGASGAWVQASCDISKCNSVQSCPQGRQSVWVRWLSDQGSILLYPYH